MAGAAVATNLGEIPASLVTSQRAGFHNCAFSKKKKPIQVRRSQTDIFFLISGASGQRRIFIEKKKKMINTICELLKKILDVW